MYINCMRFSQTRQIPFDRVEKGNHYCVLSRLERGKDKNLPLGITIRPQNIETRREGEVEFREVRVVILRTEDTGKFWYSVLDIFWDSAKTT